MSILTWIGDHPVTVIVFAILLGTLVELIRDIVGGRHG
jgi:hypothetical protein